MTNAKIIRIEPNIDDRGFLYQIYNSDLSKKIKRIYLVGNFSKGIIRGMHYHEKEWKLFFVARGSVKFVINRGDKPSDKIQAFVLSDKKPSLLIIPPKHSNGWISLNDDTLLLGMSNFTLGESLLDDKRLDPTHYKEHFIIKPR